MVEGSGEIPRVGWGLIIQLDDRGRRDGPRLNQDTLLGAILCDPDDRRPAATSPCASHGHSGIRGKREQRRQQKSDRPLIHLIYSLALPYGSRLSLVAFFNQRAVSDRCLGENCPAAARRYG